LTPRDTILVRVNGPIPGFREGQLVPVKVDCEGTPLEVLWRRRLRDAKFDGCCEIVKESEPKPKTPSPQRRVEKE